MFGWAASLVLILMENGKMKMGNGKWISFLFKLSKMNKKGELLNELSRFLIDSDGRINELSGHLTELSTLMKEIVSPMVGSVMWMVVEWDDWQKSRRGWANYRVCLSGILPDILLSEVDGWIRWVDQSTRKVEYWENGLYGLIFQLKNWSI